jgi:predicted RNA binding protein YcfA (HicA-like mRNA interferase family)
MTENLSQLVHLLRNTPVRELVGALRRDGFLLERETRTGGRIYSHPDGRITVIHYHHGSDIKSVCLNMVTGFPWAVAAWYDQCGGEKTMHNNV